MDRIQVLGVDHILSSFQMFSHAGAPLNHPPLAIHVYLEYGRYLRRFTFPFLIRSRDFEVVISFKPFNSTGGISFSSNHFNGVSFEWALTHRSFPRILPDSSNSPRVILNSFQV